jgi:hypothetical protein
VVDINPALRGQHPRNYPPGWTWERASGGFDSTSRRAMVAEYVLRGGQRRPSANVGGACREETGHSIDWDLGPGTTPMSHSDANFVQPYQADVAALTDPAEQAALAYLLAPGGAGNEETFAQLFAILYGGGSGLPAFNRLVEQRFPRTLHAVATLVPP